MAERKDGYMKDKIKEIKKSMVFLGYPNKKVIELKMLDSDRGKVIYGRHLTIGIYDFAKHTFID